MISIEAVKDRYKVLISNNAQMMSELHKLTPEQLLFKPNEGAWNILQVLDHVKNAELGTLIYIKKKLKYGGLKKTNWSAGIRKNLMNSINNSPVKFKMPKILPQPNAANNLDEVKEDWGKIREQWNKQLDEYPEEHLDKAIFKHPIFGRFSLLQAMDSMISHQNHHIHQINRIKKKMG